MIKFGGIIKHKLERLLLNHLYQIWSYLFFFEILRDEENPALVSTLSPETVTLMSKLKKLYKCHAAANNMKQANVLKPIKE